jgi:hypothetical protein
MEKDLGLYKQYKNLSEKEKAEIRKKKMMAGKQIHLQNTQEAENQRIQREAESEAKAMQGLIESGHTPEQAEAIVRKNRELAEKRATKLAARAERQKKN